VGVITVLSRLGTAQADGGVTAEELGPAVSRRQANQAVFGVGRGLPRRALPGPSPHSQSAKEKGAEEYHNADEQQVQQALDDDTHDAERDRHDH
jgi:hypothetical protein